MSKRSSSARRYPSIDLRGMEEEVLCEGREWMRRRLEEKLAAKSRSFSPGGDGEASICPKADSEA
jgi:hypothetical protein